jgi:phenylalanyl-tRNA synthetase beta chain
MGRRWPAFWSGAERDVKYDIYDLKGLLEEFFAGFGLRGVSWTPRQPAGAPFLESASVQLGKLALGEIGRLSPSWQKHYDLREAVFLAELNLDLLLHRALPGHSFKPWPAYPPIRRDVAMLVPEATTHEAVLSVIRQVKPQNLDETQLFDIFRGQNVPPGQKSMAYAFIYRNAERTLTDAEVNGAHEKLVAQFKQTLAATIRES